MVEIWIKSVYQVSHDEMLPLEVQEKPTFLPLANVLQAIYQGTIVAWG